MKFDIAFIPSDTRQGTSPICVLIDVLRASSTIVTLLDKGCSKVILTDSEDKFDDIRKMTDKPRVLICSEDLLGQRLDRADFSPSLIEVEKLGDLADTVVVMKTTNGTAGIHELMKKGIDNIFIGCMLNSEEVMNKAVSRAMELKENINIVCAGRESGKSYTIDDVYCAAKLLQYGKTAAWKYNIEAQIQDSAKIAESTLSGYIDTASAFEASASGSVMKRVNCHQDILLCARDNITKTVPKVTGCDENGFIIIEKA